jgi:hypothetical protein
MNFALPGAEPADKASVPPDDLLYSDSTWLGGNK